jgi:hypothetical protein
VCLALAGLGRVVGAGKSKLEWNASSNWKNGTEGMQRCVFGPQK